MPSISAHYMHHVCYVDEEHSPPTVATRPLGDLTYLLQEYSLTINCSGRGVPAVWLDYLKVWAETHTEAGIFAIEVGPRAGHSHLQCAFKCRAPAGEEGLRLIRSSIRRHCNMQPADQASITVKEFAKNQAFPHMIGYCMKDRGKVLFRECRVNVSDVDVAEGIEAYGLVRNLYSEGKREIQKSSLFKMAFSFWKSNMYPLRKGFALNHVLRLMICSGEYLPAAGWVITGQGSGLDFQKAESLWEIATLADPQDCKISQVNDVFFGCFGRPMVMQPDPCAYDTISLEEAREIAQEIRDGVLTDLDNFNARHDANSAGTNERRRRRDAEMQDSDDVFDPDDVEVMRRETSRVQRRRYQRGDAPVRRPSLVPLAHLTEDDNEAVESASDEFQSLNPCRLYRLDDACAYGVRLDFAGCCPLFLSLVMSPINFHVTISVSHLHFTKPLDQVCAQSADPEQH